MECIICKKEIKLVNQLKIHINRYHYVDEVENEKNFLRSINNQIDFYDIINLYLLGYNTEDIKRKYVICFRNFIKKIGIARTNSESKKTKIYEEKIKKLEESLNKAPRKEGLYYTYINPQNGEWCSSNFYSINFFT